MRRDQGGPAIKIVVGYKWARDPSAAAVRADGSVDWRNAKMSAGEDDPAALEAAKQIAAAAGGELVGLTIGDGDASWALARGVQEAYSVTDAATSADNAATASVLGAAVRYIGDVDVVVIGDSKQDPGVAPALAGLLGWSALLGVATATAQENRITATRRTDVQQTVSIAPPLVLGVAAEADVDKVPGMKEMLAARRRPLNAVTLADLGIEPDGTLTSRGTTRPEVTAARVFSGDPAQTAAQLVSVLRSEGVL